MDGILELIVEALNYHSVGVIHLFACFVADEQFITSLGMSLGYLPRSLGYWKGSLKFCTYRSSGIMMPKNWHIYRMRIAAGLW